MGAQRKSSWNPRVPAGYDCLNRTGYFAGYSDRYYGFKFGSGYEDPPAGYRVGWEDAAADRRDS